MGNIGILNVLWSVTCGRKLHAQQQEFQAVYECIDKLTQFMSRAAIFSFMPVLTKILPESITNIERGRYYRNRFHEITDKWIRAQAGVQGQQVRGHPGRLPGQDQRRGGAFLLRESGSHCSGDLCDWCRVRVCDDEVGGEAAGVSPSSAGATPG